MTLYDQMLQATSCCEIEVADGEIDPGDIHSLRHRRCLDSVSVQCARSVWHEVDYLVNLLPHARGHTDQVIVSQTLEERQPPYKLQGTSSRSVPHHELQPSKERPQKSLKANAAWIHNIIAKYCRALIIWCGSTCKT